MSDKESQTCGDFGGVTRTGDPCTRPPAWGVDGETTGPCKHHCEAATEKRNEFKRQIKEVLKGGEEDHLKDACNEVGISVATLWRLRKKDPEFDQWLEDRKEELYQRQRVNVEHSLYKKLVTGDIATAGYIFWLINRGKGDWRDKKQIAHTGPDDGPVKLDDARGALLQQLSSMADDDDDENAE